MLKFTPDPIFKFPVEIVPPGKKPERIELDFHHKTRDELNKMMHEDKLTLEQFALEVVAGWPLKDKEFSEDALKEFFQHYTTAPQSIHEAYFEAITKGRPGN